MYGSWPLAGPFMGSGYGCPASPNCPYCDDDGSEWERLCEEADEQARLEAHAFGECPDPDELEDADGH